MGSTAFRQWRAKSHCRFCHGYRLQSKIWFAADQLDENNWVYDFGDCKIIKNTLEQQFDHTTCVAADDPELETFKLLHQKGIIDLRVMDAVGIEKTAEWVFNTVNEFVQERTANRVYVLKVEVWEHEGNSAIFEQKCECVERSFSEKDTNVAPETETVHTPAPLPKQQGTPAPLHTVKSKGMTNLFAGTSWGR